MNDHPETTTAADALREREEWYRTLFNSMLEGLAYCRMLYDDEGQPADWRYLAVNPAFEQITGLKGIAGKKVTEAFPEIRKSSPELFEVYGRVVRTGTPEQFEINFTPISKWLNISVYRPKKDHFVAVFEDITERKHAEEVLKRSLARFKTVMDSLDAMVYVVDMQTYEILFINKYGRDIWGDIEGKVCWRTIQSGQTGPCPFCTNDRLVDVTGKPTGTYVWEFKNTVNGRWYDCRDSAIQWPDGRIVRMEIATDITDRKRVEEALQASEHRSAKLLEALPDMMFVVARDGTYRDYSVADPSDLAVPRDKIIGTNVRDSGFGEATTATILHHVDLALETKTLQLFEYELALPGGTRQYEARMVALTGDEALGIVRDITDRKHAEEALNENRALYRDLVENIDEVIFSVDLQGIFTYISPVIERLFGYTPQEVTGRHFLEFVHPDDQTLCIEGFNRRLKGDYEKDEFRIVTKFGSVRYVSFSPRPLKKDGRVFGFNYVMTDVTDRKVAEQKMEEHSRFLTTLMDTLPVPLFYKDTDGKYLGCNPPFEEYIGIRCSDLIGKSVYDIQPKDLADMYNTADQQMFNNPLPQNYEARVKYADGSLHDVIFYKGPFFNIDGSLGGLIGTFLDITERKTMEGALRESRQILEAVLNNIPVRVFWKDRNLVYLGCNTPFARDAGFKRPEDIIGKDDYAMGWREQADLYRADDLAVIESGTPKLLFEEPQTTPSGELISLLSSKVPLKDASGETIGVLGTYFDITDRKRAEEAVRAAVHLNQLIDTMSVAECMNYTLDEAERLTSSKIGFFHFFNPDEETLQLVAWSTETRKSCFSPKDTERHYPVSRAGVWVDCIRERKPVIHNDYASLPNKKGLPEGHVPVSRELLVPIFDEDKIVAIIGVGNKTAEYSQKDIDLVTLLAKNAWTLIQRKRIEEALKESEYRFRELFNSMSSGVAVYQAVDNGDDFVLVDFNRGAEIIDRTRKQDVIGKRISEVFPGVLEFGLLEVFQKVWHTGKPEHFPLSLYKDERIAGWRENYVYRLPTGEIVAIYDDVTDRKRAEDAIRESEEKFRMIFENSNDAILLVAAPGKGMLGEIIDANEVALRKLGYSKEEFVHEPASKIASSRLSRELPSILSELFTNGHITFENEIVRKNGTLLPVEVSARLVTLREKQFIIGIVRDITDRKRAEEAMRESEIRYRTLFEDSPISLWEEDFSLVKTWIDTKKLEGIRDFQAYFAQHPEEVPWCASRVKIISINRATMALFGVASFDEFNKGLSMVFSPESYDAFREEILALVGGQREFEHEVPLRTLRGEPKMVIMKVTVVPGYEQTFSRIFISVIDITQRKNIEEALHQANKKLSMLSSITRHDILNLIMAIRGYLELSLEDEGDPEIRRFMEKETEAVDAIQRQIEFTRYYQDIGGNEPVWQDVGEIVARVAGQMDLEGISLENPLSGLDVFADPLIEKVFYNLIENSLRHGEHVTTIRFSSSETDSGLVISYRDNGVGITDEDRKKLFQRGFGKHTGLGLFLSREILSITGITMRENGEPGKGVCFEILVPKGRFRDTRTPGGP